ncbi:MAG: hypothetical protein QNJ64_21140 [Crocosphaera sp.]|nr:hypothetical protein [Crocosphaera sp.]
MINSQKEKITVLGSGVALGVYIPALLVNTQFKKQNLDSEVVVIENFYKKDSKDKLKGYKKAYHKNFSVALMGHKMTKDISSSLDDNLVDQLLQTWQQENRLHFIIWSGLWIPIVEKYRELVAPQKIIVDACRIDADISATFKIFEGNYEYDNDIWLWNWEQQQLIYELPVTNQTPIPYTERENRFVTHGGGWGIGTYQNRIAELEEQGFLLDIVAYNIEEATNPKPGNRYFMVDPNWSPWHKNQHDRHDFPPFGEVTNINEQHFTTKEEYHGFYDLAKKSKAIISKPGGGTLIDSLSSATPIILLEAYGYAEEKNAAIWEHFGYGISYEKWKELNYSEEVLLQLHQNLLAKKNLINYPQKYAERLFK